MNGHGRVLVRHNEPFVPATVDGMADGRHRWAFLQNRALDAFACISIGSIDIGLRTKSSAIATAPPIHRQLITRAEETKGAWPGI
jgi:hypothetical protein